MLLRDLFTPADFVLGFQPTDKWAAIAGLLEHLVARGRVEASQAQRMHELVLERERSMSTGMERGLAIPHAAVEGLPRVIACMATIADPRGLPFDTIDQKPAQIVVLLLIPRAQKLLHIRTLADIARVLSRESVRDALLAARTGEEAWNALANAEGTARPTSA